MKTADEKEIIDKSVPAIKANKGWELYYNKNKVYLARYADDFIITATNKETLIE